MSDPGPRPAEGASLWAAFREFLNIKAPNSLRESIEEAIDEHEDGTDPDDLDRNERTMLRNMLHLSDRKVGDVAVPRSDIIAIELESAFPDVVTAFREAGHSRLPIYSKSLDEVVGMLHVKDVYSVIAERYGATPVADERVPHIADLMRPVLYVPPSMPVADLLADMRRSRTHMAVVVDEYGGTDGLVTIEDVVEEIVGDIEDEHDDEVLSLLERHADGSLAADARLQLDDLERELDISFADADGGDDVDTLGGLVFLLAGRVPETGEKLVHANGWTLEIAASDGRRVERLRLYPPVSASSPADA